jgi:argininosuccinate synthase
VVAVCVDVGQGEDLAAVRDKALATGCAEALVLDRRDEFVAEFAFRALRAGAVYQGRYLLGTALARPLIARTLVEVARQIGATAIAHGATGKGNDQVRFEAGVAALAPDLEVIAPWREWRIRSRQEAMAYAQAHGVPVSATPAEPYSRDANLWHISHEGGVLEDPGQPAPAGLLLRTAALEDAPDAVLPLTVRFAAGTPVAMDGRPLGPAALLGELNAIAGAAGVGVADMVEDRLVGIKSRGVYETPGGTVLHQALAALQSVALDRRSRRLLQELGATYADLVYDGLWYTPVREAIDAAVDRLLSGVDGEVRLHLYKGHVLVRSILADRSLYDLSLASFDQTGGGIDHPDATGFLRVYTLPLKVAGLADRATAAADVE